MIEAPDVSRLLSGERADTNRPNNGRTNRGRTPDKSTSGRFVCHVASPTLPLPGGQRGLRTKRRRDPFHEAGKLGSLSQELEARLPT
jgi:hypothetical protein